MRVVVLLLVVIFSSTVSSAQIFKKKNKKKEQPSVSAANSLEPQYPKGEYAPKRASKTSRGPTYESREEFIERMAKLEKTRRKNEKLMLKPQYSDPMYFGHKRPPKKRKPGKMKFCKECGMRH